MHSKNIEVDIVIIGTGIGGGTIGSALASSGAKVLFLEKGLANPTIDEKYTGDYFERLNPSQAKNKLLYYGRSNEIIYDTSHFLKKKFIPFIGMGLGGSSAIYGAIFERMKKSDFSPGSFYKNKEVGDSVVDKWPITYEELLPYYEKAEALYGVKTNTTLSPGNKYIWDLLKQKKISPYLLSSATEKNSCLDNCQSFLCKHSCKNESAKNAVLPAVKFHGAKIIDQCEVVKVHLVSNQITSIYCKTPEGFFTVKAQKFIFAAGAIGSPILLGKLGNLANSSGLVGSNLMRHLIDIFLIGLKDIKNENESQKQIAFNDFYETSDGKFGNVQSFGHMPPLEIAINEMKYMFPLGLGMPLHFILKAQLPLLKGFYDRYFENKVALASILEDLPNTNNKIIYRNNRIELNYKLGIFDKDKIKHFRKKMTTLFENHTFKILAQAENNQRLAHACGTCRFGDDPKNSVLNRFNKTHDLENVFVVDASFFPSSTGTNPSLTIAANALRVADSIIQDSYNKK